jgi:hypothetical protein
LATLTPGPIFYLLYNSVIVPYFNFTAALVLQRINLSIVMATFSFTMLGFLAAIITVLFGMGQTHAFRKFREKGYLDLFFFIYLFSVVNLGLTFLLAILGFSSRYEPFLFNSMLMSSVNNIFQISLITIIILNMFKKASQEM